MLHRGIYIGIAFASLALPGLASAQATFTTFVIGGTTNYSRATGVSANGTVASGFAGTSNLTIHAMRWQSGVGTQDLGLVNGQGVFDHTRAWGVSGDGGTLVGERYGTNGTASYPSVALRWTVANGYELLGTMAGGVTSTATAANDDGSIISGNGDSTLGTNRAFRWVAGSGFEDLGTLSGGTSAYAARMSLDGGVIVGYGNTSAGVNHAFRWTSGGMDDLGVLPGMTESFATDVTGDGSAIVGYSGTSTADRRPFRWVGGVMEDLGLFPGSSRTSALGVSPDGATIVGSYYNGRERAFLWREGIGYQDLTEYANEQGLNLNSQFGPWLVQASDVSNGGRTFVGYQGGFSAQTWGYVMTVPVPEPLTLATVGLGVLLAGRRRRKRGLAPSALNDSATIRG